MVKGHQIAQGFVKEIIDHRDLKNAIIVLAYKKSWGSAPNGQCKNLCESGTQWIKEFYTEADSY